MRYEILKPSSPIDPRNLDLTSLDALLAIAPLARTCELEAEAVETVREIYPDAVAMPIPVKLGGGTAWLMAVVANEADNHGHPKAEIPFVLFVRAVAEFSVDHKRFRNHTIYDRKKWKAPVHHAMATTAKPVEIEVRGTDLDEAISVNAIIGRVHDGRLVITAEVGGIEVSFTFKDPAMSLIRITGTSEGTSEGTLTLSSDGNSVGSSYDPTPH